MNKQAAFLFGSGISIPSDLPSVGAITDDAGSGEWHFHTDGRFYPRFAAGSTTTDLTTAAVQAFLRSVNDIAADYLTELARHRPCRRPHYEDWFSLVEQASRTSTEHVPNLVVVECLRRMRQQTAPIHCGFKTGSLGRDGFGRLATLACDLIHWAVHHSLAKKVDRQGLDLISETAAAVQRLDIFSLNHDCLIEAQLNETVVGDFEFGFGNRDWGKCSVYSGWPAERKRVRLFKLHGSLNWYLYDFPGLARQYAIPDGHADYCEDRHGTKLFPVGGKAAFLSGTIVKERQYGVGFWGDLFSNFRSHLSQHTHLICCGYGFADPGINQRLAQWMDDRLDGSNKLVIMHTDEPEAYLADKPSWLTHLYVDGRVKFVNRFLEDCPLSGIEEYFDRIN